MEFLTASAFPCLPLWDKPLETALLLVIAVLLVQGAFTKGGWLAAIGVVGVVALADHLNRYTETGGLRVLFAAGVVFFLFKALASHRGRRHPRRTAQSMASNLLPGALLALVYGLLPNTPMGTNFGVALLIASLSAVLFDTVSGEMAQAAGARPFWPKGASAGQLGAVSWQGLAYGWLAVILFSLLAITVGYLPSLVPQYEVLEEGLGFGAIYAFAAMLASLADSWLGARCNLGKGLRNIVAASFAPVLFIMLVTFLGLGN